MAALLFPAVSAQAGGMYLTDRGTRPLGRGFAFVAGADDPGALWYNPAGISFAGQQLFLDATLTAFDAEYQRIDGGGNVLPTVEDESQLIPIPGVGYTHPIGDFTVGAGVFVPNIVPIGWPEEITVDGAQEPAPQRYSLIDLEGSGFAHIVLGGAWRPTPELSVGAGFHLIVGQLVAVTTLSACDRVICTQPENPDYDSLAQVERTLLTATGQLGVTYDLGVVRLGASFMLPHSHSGDATIRVRLPSAAIFDGARVDGDQGELDLDFPWVLRAGVEVRPVDELRAEASFVYEAWSTQDEMRITPKDVWLRDVTAIGDYQVGAVSIPRRMNDVISVRIGAEYGVTEQIDVRAGLNYENGGFDDPYLTALTLDSDKLVLGLGASFEASEGLFIDAAYGHVFLADREVRDSQVPQANPIRPPPMGEEPPDGPVYVGNGDYSMEANMFGVGLRWVIDAAPAAAPEPDGDLEAPELAPAEPSTAPASGPTDPGAEPPPGDAWEAPDDAQPWYERGQPE